MVTNTLEKDSLGEGDFRKTLPRFDDEHWENNAQLAKAFAELASEKNCSPAQLALEWVLAQGKHIIPIPGTKRRKYLIDNAGAVDVSLSASDLQNIETLLKKYPNIGDRYAGSMAKMVGK